MVDPMGGSLNNYRKVAKVIDHPTDELTARLSRAESPPGA
jgi:hypothetical protein